MRATSYESEQKRGTSEEEAQVGEGKMHVARTVGNSPSSVVDVEKGEVYQTDAPAPLENLITHAVEDNGEASHSKPLIGAGKIVATLLVVCFVIVEAYFVGVSIGDWLDKHKHGNSTIVLQANHDVELVFPQFLQVYKAGADGGGQDQVTGDSEPFEDFEGGLSLKATRVIFDKNHQIFSGETYSTERTVLEEEPLNLEDTAIRDSPSLCP